MHLSMAAGRLVDVIEEDTLADGLAGSLGPVNRHTLRMCETYLDETALVSEAEIATAMAYARDVLGCRLEGAGAVGIAALMTGRVEVPFPAAVIVSGRNVDDEVLAAVR